MTGQDWAQIALYLVALVACVPPLGWYMARVYENKSCGLDKVMGPLERLFYRISCANPEREMGWKDYAIATLLFNVAGLSLVYLIQRVQGLLPLNPAGLSAVSQDSSFNTAVSFASNTNWQGYGGEVTMSYLTQMTALGVQNFLSAATGMAVLVALIRGLVRKNSATIGNFWVDLTRSTLYILLPLSCVLAIALVAEGVPQTFRPYQTVTRVQPVSYDDPQKDDQGNVKKGPDGKDLVTSIKVETQVLPLGPVASQIAIKQLGTNGGGYYNVNSAHPYENPTPWSNFLEMLAILALPAALCYTFGVMVKDARQGWAILAAMFAIFIPLLILCTWCEKQSNPKLTALGIDSTSHEHETPPRPIKTLDLPGSSIAVNHQSGGNMEGKETRFGVVNSTIWATATTAASNGSVNAMHDSFTPLGGMVPLFLIQLGEVIFGGVGSGLYGMLVFAIIAVFVAGLMVGRTPEYLGKKIEPYEMKMASLIILIPPVVVKLGTAIAVVYSGGTSSVYNTGNPHGFTEILYAFSSAGNNNGSAFGGLNANTPFYNIALGIAMFASRFWLIVPVLAIAGSLARKKYVPPGPGTLPTHNALFIVLLVSTVLLVGALAFIPALALGPVVEHLMLY